MKIITSFEDLPKTPFAFTIGMFDGVHLGHRALLHRLSSFSLPSVVLTFPEHPLQVLGRTAPRLITPLAVKLNLLESVGVHTTLTFPFTREFAHTPFETVLKTVSAKRLLFGKGAAFGYGRLGDEAAVRKWAAAHSTEVEYIEKQEIQGHPISSSRIREAIARGHLNEAEQLLGHPYFFFIPAQMTRWDVSKWAVPPDGTYVLQPDLIAHISDHRWATISNPLSKPTFTTLRNTL